MATTTDLFKYGMQLSDDEREAFLSACATRGRNKGFLLSNCPRDRKASLAWTAIMSGLCPQRVSVGSLMFIPAEDMEFFYKLSGIINASVVKTLVLVEPYMRWNVWELNWPGPLRTKVHEELERLSKCTQQST